MMFYAWNGFWCSDTKWWRYLVSRQAGLLRAGTRSSVGLNYVAEPTASIAIQYLFRVHNCISTSEESLFHFSVGCRSCALEAQQRAGARGGARGCSARYHSVVGRGGGTAPWLEASWAPRIPIFKLANSAAARALNRNIFIPSLIIFISYSHFYYKLFFYSGLSFWVDFQKIH